MYTIKIPKNVKEFKVVIEDDVEVEATSAPAQVAEPIKNKFALLIGIDYKNTDNELRGCINDNVAIKEFLGKRDYKIRSLTDDGKEDSPIVKNIAAYMNAVIADAADAVAKYGKAQIFFHYSGHGTQVKDRDGDERDGKDEAMCAVDGLITDDDLHSFFLARLPKECDVFLLTDCCHSGTLLDMQYSIDLNGQLRHVSNKKDIQCNAKMVSGCRDHQTSADAYIRDLKEYRGAATTAFLKTVEKHGDNLSISKLLNGMHGYLSNGRYSQKPVFSMSKNGSAYDAALY